MKKRLFLIGLTGLLLCAVQSAQGAPTEDLFSKVKISLSISNPPGTASSNSTPSASNSWRNKWLIIAIEFYPALPEKERNTWLDDSTLTVRAIFNGQSDGRAQSILFTGKSTFWTISMDNRKHIATMMVPPHLLDRYLPSNGSASTVSISSTFVIEAVFRDRAGTALGTGYFGQRGWPDEKYAEYFAKLNAGSVLTVPGAILPRNQTPWAFNDFDSFDLLKPDGGESALK